MPARTRRLAFHHDRRRGVVLLSALVVGGALAWQARAQTAPAAPAAVETPAQRQAGRVRLSSAQVQQAFHHIDRDRDGHLSRREVAVFPRIDRQFERVDANRDGNISAPEFEQALQRDS